MQGSPKQAAQRTGASRLLRSLCQHARICFANPGTTEMHLTAALDELQGDECQGMRAVLCLHETVAAGAADGYARMTTQPAAVLLHLGPGLANGLANLHNARRARSPVLCIIGDMATWHVSADPVLAMDITSIARTVSCTVARATRNTAPSSSYAIRNRQEVSNRQAGSGSQAPSNTTVHAVPRNSSSMSDAKGHGIQIAEIGTPAGSIASQLDWADTVHDVLGGLYDAAASTAAVAHAVGSTSTATGAGMITIAAASKPAANASLSSSGNTSNWALSAGPSESRVVTLIIPHDLSWETQHTFQPEPSLPAVSIMEPSFQPEPSLPAVETNKSSSSQAFASVASHSSNPGVTQGPLHSEPRGRIAGLQSNKQVQSGLQLSAATLEFIKQCAAALKAVPRGAAALYLGGDALLATDGALQAAGLVAASCGAALLCENAFARADRGVGLPRLQRLPYFPQEAARVLSQFQMLVAVDARLPVANFGYQDGPSQLVPGSLIAKDAVWEIDAGGGPPGTVAACLKALAEAVGAAACVRPGVNCGGLFMTTAKPPTLPDAGVRLNPSVLCQCVAALQPQDCVMVDESLTSGGAYWDLTHACPPFAHLTLTGGAIGSGPPMALGAALATGRCVVNLQADGSAMYSLQALWSQARERAHVVTIICANNAYNILKVECARQRITAMGSATRCLTDLSSPAINWVDLAHGMGVPAVAVHTAGELCAALCKGIDTAGPMLIQAML